MPSQQIGVKFLPNAEHAALGPRQGSIEGVPEQAFKILSLRLPRVQGARAISPPALMTSPGSAGVPGGNPMAAVFEALLRAMTGGQGTGLPPQGAQPGSLPGGARTPQSVLPPPVPARVPPPLVRPGAVPTVPRAVRPSPPSPVSTPGGGTRLPRLRFPSIA